MGDIQAFTQSTLLLQKLFPFVSCFFSVFQSKNLVIKDAFTTYNNEGTGRSERRVVGNDATRDGSTRGTQDVLTTTLSTGEMAVPTSQYHTPQRKNGLSLDPALRYKILTGIMP